MEPDKPRLIYHLCLSDSWNKVKPMEDYRTKSLDDEGFVHCTEHPNDLIRVANLFYKDIPGEFVCLELDVDMIRAKTVWEDPAHPKRHHDGMGFVGDKVDTKKLDVIKFPHVYGGIRKSACIRLLKLARSKNGKFNKIIGLYRIA